MTLPTAYVAGKSLPLKKRARKCCAFISEILQYTFLRKKSHHKTAETPDYSCTKFFWLGAGREAGDRLCQFILEDGQVVAVLIWCAAAWHLKRRDETIGWDPVTRSHRLKLVVQLRRFLVLYKARRPNLASQSLGQALRSVTSQWLQTHGYEPLLAESFSDPESHAGTVYKVTNWQLAGETKGSSQVRKSDTTHDYYEPNGRPKKL